VLLRLEKYPLLIIVAFLFFSFPCLDGAVKVVIFPSLFVPSAYREPTLFLLLVSLPLSSWWRRGFFPFYTPRGTSQGGFFSHTIPSLFFLLFITSRWFSLSLSILVRVTRGRPPFFRCGSLPFLSPPVSWMKRLSFCSPPSLAVGSLYLFPPSPLFSSSKPNSFFFSPFSFGGRKLNSVFSFLPPSPSEIHESPPSLLLSVKSRNMDGFLSSFF